MSTTAVRAIAMLVCLPLVACESIREARTEHRRSQIIVESPSSAPPSYSLLPPARAISVVIPKFALNSEDLRATYYRTTERIYEASLIGLKGGDVAMNAIFCSTRALGEYLGYDRVRLPPKVHTLRVLAGFLRTGEQPEILGPIFAGGEEFGVKEAAFVELCRPIAARVAAP